MADKPYSPATGAAENEAIESIAREWTSRAQDPAFRDWAALTQWLSEDSRHAESFHRLSILDAEIVDLLREPPLPLSPTLEKTGAAGSPRRGERAGSRGMAGLRWAAGLALPLILAGSLLLSKHHPTPSAEQAIAITVHPGEQKAITLADGSRLTLAGGTEMVLDGTGRQATLSSGRAIFDVVHHSGQPFTVRIGDVTVTDVGTRFALRRSAQGIDVAVSRGEIRVDHGDNALSVVAGQALRLDAAGHVTPSRITPEIVGSWAQGRLDYADATVGEIAADLTASTGLPIYVAPTVEGRRFGGVIPISDDLKRDPRPLGPMLGVSVHRTEDGWRFDDASRVAGR